MDSRCQVTDRPSLSNSPGLLAFLLATKDVFHLGVRPSPVSGLGASWKPLDLQGRLIPSQALLRARFRGEIPDSGVCATQEKTQLYPHEEERRGMCRKGHFLPFLPDPHSLVVHTIM